MPIDKEKIEKILFQYGTWKVNFEESIDLNIAKNAGKDFTKKLIELQDTRIAFSDLFHQYFMSATIFSTAFAFGHYQEKFQERLAHTAIFDAPITVDGYCVINAQTGLITAHMDIWCHDEPFCAIEILDFTDCTFRSYLKDDALFVCWEFDADRAHFPEGYMSLDDILEIAKAK